MPWTKESMTSRVSVRKRRSRPISEPDVAQRATSVRLNTVDINELSESVRTSVFTRRPGPRSSDITPVKTP